MRIRLGGKHRRINLSKTTRQQEDKAFQAQKYFSAQLISVILVQQTIPVRGILLSQNSKSAAKAEHSGVNNMQVSQ